MAVESGRGQAAHPTRGAVAARSTGNHAAAAAVRAMPEFVGRRDALTTIVTALHDGPSLVIVEGEAGIGKTRLVREALTHLGDAPKVLVAACPPLQQPFPLGAVVDGVRRLRPDVSTLGLSPLGGALRPVFPEWAEALPPALEGLDDPQEVRHRLFHALTELVEHLTVRVLVVEDAHWADTATLEWLLTLCAAGGLPVSIVVTYRPTDVADGSLLPRLTSRVLPLHGQVRIELRPLDVADTRRLVGSMFDTDDVSEEFAKFLHERTDGIPLALEETVRLLRERRDIVHHKGGGWARRLLDEIDVPATVRDSVLERVERLDSNTRRVLEAAAVLAAGADETLLAAVGDLDDTAADAGIARALASGLLQETNPGRYVFRHVLDAQAIGEAIPISTRRRLHRRAGEALQAGDHPSVTRLAGHFRQAGDTETWSHYAEAAADLTLESGDDHTAVTLLYEVLTEAEHPPGRRARLARKLGQAANYGATALDHLAERVTETLEAVLADGGIPEGERGEVRLLLGRLLYMHKADAAVAVIEAALPELREQPALAARAMLYLAMPHSPTWPVTKHLEWLDRATELLPNLSSDSERLWLTTKRATVLLLMGQDAGWEAAAEIPQTATPALDRRIIAGGMVDLAQMAITWGRYADVGWRLALAIELAAGYPRIVNTARVTQLYLDWYTGVWQDLADTAGDLAGSLETGGVERMEAGLVQGLVDVVRGNRRAAEKRMRQVAEELARRGLVEPPAVSISATFGRLHLADGQISEALEVTTPTVEMIAQRGLWMWITDIAPVHLDALIGTGELDQAEDMVGRFANGIAGRDAPAPEAALVTCRAILAEAKGYLAEAARLFAEAVPAWTALPRPYDEVLARERQGRALLAANRQDEALEVLSDTRKRLDELGARWDADRVAQLLRQHGVEVARIWRRGRHGYGDQLSPRELEVVRLVAQGMTNRQAASALFVSPRTIAAQLSAAMRKLGVSSRTAVAMAAVEAGLLDGDPQDGATDSVP